MIRKGLSALREMSDLTRQWPDLRILAISGIFGTLGAGLLNPIMPLYLGSRGLDLERIGAVFTLGSLLPMFLQPVLGALSDRFDRRRFVIGISIVTSLFVPVFALLENPLFLAAALASKLMIERSAAPVSSALIGDRAPKDKRATVFGLLSSVTNLVFVAALVASSAVVAVLKVQNVFFFAGACFLLGGFVLFRLKKEPKAPSPGPAEPHLSGFRAALHGLRSPLQYAKEDPAMPSLLGYQFCFTFALDLFPIYLPVFAVELGAPPSAVGPLVAASWLVYAFVLPLGGRLSDRASRRKGLIVFGLTGMVVFGVVLGMAGSAPPAARLPLLIAAWVAIAVPDGLFRPAADALVVDLAPPAERGRFLGALGVAQSVANVVAPIAYGMVAKRRSLAEAFLLSSVALLCAVLFIARAPSRRAEADLVANLAKEAS